MSAALTPTQYKVLAFIRKYRAANQMPPTRAEISKNFEWASANAAQDVLQALERKGEIHLTVGVARGIFDMQVSK